MENQTLIVREGKYLSKQVIRAEIYSTFINDKQGAVHETHKAGRPSEDKFSRQQIRCLLISKNRNG